MRKYEAFYIISGAHPDATVQQVTDKFKSVVENNGGSVESATKWDKRKLAYEIKGHKEGNYILMHFEADPKVPSELNRQMRNDDNVLRHRIYLREC